jgi:hypothetical protein
MASSPGVAKTLAAASIFDLDHFELTSCRFIVDTVFIPNRYKPPFPSGNDYVFVVPWS